MNKFKYNYVLIQEWYNSDDSPTTLDLLRTPFSWNHEKIREYVKSHYGKYVNFEIVTNYPTIAEEE